jgi:outer membrane protein assembly factor BamB
MPLDRAFHVVGGDGSIYFGNSGDDTVYALDAGTGQVRWRCATDGPVRFAPALWKDRVLVASDDGHLYALAAKDGSVEWRHRGGPGHEKRLGNERMISKWPARGGPVVVDDTVYYAAGIWPSDGVYLYAIDALSGVVRWKNDDSGSIEMPQPHGGANAESGVAAQGYLLIGGLQVAGDEGAKPLEGTQIELPPLEKFRPGLIGPSLLVPTGRAIPAAFDRGTGKFQYFHLQQYGQRGGAPSMAAGSYFFNSGIAFDVRTGKESQKLGEGPIAATADGLVRSTGNQVAGYRWVHTEMPDRRGEAVRSVGLKPLWSVKDVDARAEMIVAGDRVICGGKDRVGIIDPSQQKVVWSADVEGTAYSLAVCDGQLLVSTDAGHIYCFAPGKPKQSPAIVTDRIEISPYEENPKLASAAAAILRNFGHDEGYCLDFGCGDGQLTYELARRSRLRIWAIDANAENVALARQRFLAAGLYGTRVVVHQARLDDTGYPDYFADLIVSRRALETGASELPAAEYERFLRPAGGISLLGKAGELARAERSPLPGSGTWTHQYASAANSLCSADERVQGTLGMLWFRDVDTQMPQRHGRGPGPLYDAGRLYSLGLEELVCLNAYNGRVLWKHPLPGILKAYDGDELMGAAGTGSNYCLAAGSVYVRRDDHCLRIDAATGELLGTFVAPRQEDGKPGVWGYIACEGGLLLGSLANREHVVTYRYVDRGGDMSKLLTESATLFALDAKTGELKWRYDAKDSIRHNAIAVGGGVVYLIDRPLAMFDRTREKQPTEHPTGALLALDAASGEVRWKNDKEIFGTMLALSPEHGTLLMSYQPTRFRLVSEIGGWMAAFATADGKRRWEKKANYESRPLINNYTIYAQGGAWDLLTGEERKFDFRRSYGCGVLAGSRHMLLFRSATLGYYDVSGKRKTENFGGMRPGCWINAIAAGGLVLVPDASAGCQCSYLNQSWFALEPRP